MIRRPRPGEARALARIDIDTWQHTYRDDFETEFLEGLDIDHRERWFESRLEHDGLLVAEADERGLVGYCFFGESSDSGWGEVFAIYVHPDDWGRGHGFRLLEATQWALHAARFEKALLWVLESNERARRFYERQGWQLGKPIRLEEIGGTQVTEVRYETRLLSQPPRDRPDR